MSLEYDVGTNLGIGFFNPAQSKEMWFRRFNSVAISKLALAQQLQTVLVGTPAPLMLTN